MTELESLQCSAQAVADRAWAALRSHQAAIDRIASNPDDAIPSDWPLVVMCVLVVAGELQMRAAQPGW